MQLLAALALTNACVVTLVGLYQLWFFAQRTERRDALWAGVMALASAVYAASQVVFYESDRLQVPRVAAVAPVVAAAVIVHCVPSFTAALTGRPIRGWRWFAPSSVAVWAALAIGTDWVVPDRYAPISLALLPYPYPQTASTGLMTVFLIYCACVVAFGTLWLVRAKAQRSELMFLLGFGLWIASGVHDILVILQLYQRPILFLAEHGYLAFVLALFARQIREYAAALVKAESAAQASQQSFRDLIELSPELIAVVCDGRIAYMNPAAAQQLGYDSVEELVGRSVPDVFPPARREAAAEAVAALAHADSPTPPLETRVLRRDGTEVAIEIIALPVRFEQRPSVLCIARDLSERHRLQARMMQLDRIISVGTLASGVAHEINNPLTAMLANLDVLRLDLDELVKAGAPPSPQALEAIGDYIDDAKDGARRIRDIVRDLAVLARAPVHDRRAVRLVDIVEPALKLATSEMKHRARLVCDFGPTEPVLADAARLSQVVLNLVVNAAQAIPVGHMNDHEIRVRTGMREGRVALEVEDTGCGIPAEIRDRIFEPFVTTKPLGQGTGLGLAISRQIVHDHGGEIVVASEVGFGSTFTVLLPPTRDAVTPPPSAAPQPPSPDRRARVLVIDDEPLIIRSVRRALEREHDLDTVTRGAAALELLEADRVYDLILCDLMMPEMTGPELYCEIDRRWPAQAARTVFMTGATPGSDMYRLAQRLGVTIVQKPFDAAVLRELVLKRMEDPE